VRPPTPPLPAVVLAAGGSSRMGRTKALIPQAHGGTALRGIVEACRKGGCGEVLVVAGADADAVLAEAEASGARGVENGAWKRGRSTSIKAALPHLPPGTGGLLLFPVDHPLVGAEVVSLLREAFEETPSADVVLPVHGGRRGHPVVVAARLFPALALLGDDQPLRDLFHAPGRALLEVPVPSDSVLRNIDTP